MRKLLTACSYPGCPNITKDRYCPKHKRPNDYDYHRPEYRKLYNTRWRRESKRFLAEHPLCAVCGKPSEVTDHIIPHKGDYDLFWSSGNWQALCVVCHNAKTKREQMEEKKSNHERN